MHLVQVQETLVLLWLQAYCGASIEDIHAMAYTVVPAHVPLLAAVKVAKHTASKYNEKPESMRSKTVDKYNLAYSLTNMTWRAP